MQGSLVVTCLQYLQRKAAPATQWGFWRLADCASRVRPWVVRLALLESGSESLVCTLDAPDRRSPAFYPFEIQSPNSNALLWLKDAFRGSQHKRFSRNGLIAAAEAMENAEICSQWAASLLDCCARRAAPLLRVFRSETNLLRP